MAPLTSIVILTRNQLEYTRRCVESIRCHTPEPIEFVFVDNGSSDGTVEYLRSVPGSLVIENERNLGFGGGCNLGIAAARGERILLLNNDVVVTHGWLAALHRELDANPRAGIVGPRSNRIAGTQQVPDGVEYDEENPGRDLDAWARTWSSTHRGTSTPTLRVVGFCMLVERAVIDRIGGFDLRYGLGNFEDDDICLRAACAGFELRIVHDSFVHHFGSRTFVGERIDYMASMRENFERFARIWRMTPDQVDLTGGSYDAGAVVGATSFDPSRMYAPVVGVPDAEEQVNVESRANVVAVCCDRFAPGTTRAALAAVMDAYGPHDDVTILVRVDPRDQHAFDALEAAADEVGDELLPDIAVVEASDENDMPIIRRADVLLAHGRWSPARAGLARHLGTATTDLAQLTARGSIRGAA